MEIRRRVAQDLIEMLLREVREHAREISYVMAHAERLRRSERRSAIIAWLLAIVAIGVAALAASNRLELGHYSLPEDKTAPRSEPWRGGASARIPEVLSPR